MRSAKGFTVFVLAALIYSLMPALHAMAGDIFLKEEFSTLDAWKTFNFPHVTKHTAYTIAPGAGKNILKAESKASASALVLNRTFNVYEYPVIKWRWKADNVYKKGDCGETKCGDDYPIRVYVLFKFEPDKACFAERWKFKAAKLIYGDYPPKCSLDYVWSNRDSGRPFYPSPSTDKSMIITKSFPKDVGQWQYEEANIVDDYRRVYGEDPPLTATISIMNDSDSTGEQSVSYVDFIEICK